MKRTIRNLIVAAPLATIALTMTPGSAMAFEPGPQKPIAIPTPDPHPGPGDIAPKPKPTKPKGPGNLAIPAPKPVQPKPGQPGDNSEGEQTDTAADDTDAKTGTAESATTVPDACLTHDLECDASAPVAKAAAGEDDANGMELTWLLAGGAIVSASGVAFAARKRSRRNA